MIKFSEYLYEAENLTWNKLTRRDGRLEKTAEIIRLNQLIDRKGKPINLKDPVGLANRFEKMKNETDFNNTFKDRKGFVANIETSSHGTISWKDVAPASVTKKEDSITNKGNTSEGILVAAVFAKFLKRKAKDEVVEPITDQDVINTINLIAKNIKKESSKGTESVIQVSAEDLVGKVFDKMNLIIKLRNANFNDLINKAPKLMKREISSAVKYANAKPAQRYANYIYKNALGDTVDIIADGISDETGTKVDAYVDLTPGGGRRGGKKTRSKINVSLKVGSKQFGQVGGASYDNLVKFFSPFEVDNALPSRAAYDAKYEEDRQAALEWVYGLVAKEFEKKVADKDDFPYLKVIARAVKHYATLNDDSVKLVDFDGGDFTQLSLSNIEYLFGGDEKGENRKVDLVVQVDKTAESIYIRFRDANLDSEKAIFHIRFRKDKGGNRYRNYVEKDAGFKRLFVDRSAK